MGGNQDNEEIKEQVEDLAKEITQKYVRELNSEAIKKALKNKTRNLSEKETKKLEKQLKDLNDEEKLSRFKEASDEIVKGILDGNITGEKAIEQMSGVLENPLKIKISLPGRVALSFKNIPLTVKMAIYILIPFIVATALCIMPSLSVSEGDMSFNLAEGESDSDQFQISNPGAGVLLWTASSDQPWITLSPNRGANRCNVIVRVDAEDMEEGTYEGTVTIESPAGTEQCPVYLSVEPSNESRNPVLAVDTDPLSFNSSLIKKESKEELEISNVGEGTLEWEASADKPWINLSPESGTNSGTVTVGVQTDKLDSGIHEGNITINSNGGSEVVNLYVIDIIYRNQYILIIWGKSVPFTLPDNLHENITP